MVNMKVSKQVLLDGAQMSITATITAVAGFLKEHNIPFKEFVTYMGNKFEGSFGDLDGRGADEVMGHLLTLEVLPMGVEVISSQMSGERAEVTLTSLPPREVLGKFGTTPKMLLEDFGVAKGEYESIYESYEPALKAIGFKFKHHSKDNHEILTLERTINKAK